MPKRVEAWEEKEERERRERTAKRRRAVEGLQATARDVWDRGFNVTLRLHLNGGAGPDTAECTTTHDGYTLVTINGSPDAVNAALSTLKPKKKGARKR
jgi:hypothetical protein